MRKKRISYDRWAATLETEHRALAEKLLNVHPQDLKGMYGRAWISDIFEAYSFEEIEKRLEQYNNLKRQLVPGVKVINARRKTATSPTAPLAVIISADKGGGYTVIDSNLDFDFWETFDCKPTAEFMNIEELKERAEAWRTKTRKLSIS